MKDIISVERVSHLHPAVRDAFRHLIDDSESLTKRTFRVVRGLATFAEQQVIYDQGRKTPGKIVTYSPPGASYHNYGLAIDLAPLTADGKAIDWGFSYRDIVPIATSYGLTWGGNFTRLKDMDHFEKTFGQNWRTLLDKHNKKDFIPGTEYVNL
jgi:peptidoglycan L-alanyl-D-glutamate endopeptidase CwlK